MAVEGKNETITVTAGADLTGLQYHVVSVAGTMAATDTAAAGVLQSDTVESGEYATLTYKGLMKAKAGGTITAGAALTLTASGTLQVGSLTIVGKALSAASSGGLVSFIGDFSTAV
jgi:hypothetical protein